jgi:hypothetical protein
MNNKRLNLYFRRALISALLLFTLSGCSTQQYLINESAIADDAPLPVFILGEWHSIEIKGDEFDTSDIQYKIVFETETQVKFIVIYPEGRAEGYTLPYSFVDQNTIFVDNKRIIGGETWLLEKKDANLIVTSIADNKTMIIVLERTK